MHEQSALVAAEGSGAWVSLNRYLEGGSGDAESVRALFVGAGFANARLSFRSAVEEVILVDGQGGPEELRLALRHGSLVLTAPTIGPFATSAMMRALTRSTLSAVMTPSRAAGINRSTSSSRSSWFEIC